MTNQTNTQTTKSFYAQPCAEEIHMPMEKAICTISGSATDNENVDETTGEW